MSRKTCSHCLQTGHNRRTCPQRSDQGKQHDATINKRKGRKCGYCLTRGHNRRTCEALEGDFQVFKWLSGKVRQALLDRIVEADLGLGTMFVQEVYEYGDKGYYKATRPFFIAGYNWGGVDLFTDNPHTLIKAKRVGTCTPTMNGERQWSAGRLLRMLHRQAQGEPDHFPISPANGRTAIGTTPSDWLECNDLTLRRLSDATDEFSKHRKRVFGGRRDRESFDVAPEVVIARQALGLDITENQYRSAQRYYEDPAHYGVWPKKFILTP